MIGTLFEGRRRSLALILLGVIMATAVACTVTVEPTGTPTPTPVSPTVTVSPVPPAGAPEAVIEIRAILVDGKVDLDRSEVDASAVRFNVMNEGTIVHGLAIMGGGIDQRTNDLNPGESATLEVRLTPGEYEVYCPVDGHREQGMTTKLIVRD